MKWRRRNGRPLDGAESRRGVALLPAAVAQSGPLSRRHHLEWRRLRRQFLSSSLAYLRSREPQRYLPWFFQTKAHRLVLASFSNHFETVLLDVEGAAAVELDVDPKITGLCRLNIAVRSLCQKHCLGKTHVPMAM